MSDPVSAAKSAREALARALGAIQADPKVPHQLMGIAEPISNAMGALFQIEKSGGAAAAAHAPAALEATRRALGLLQQQPSNHPAVQQALEAVAGSLGLIHGLTKHAPAAPPAPAPQRPPPAPPQHVPPQQAHAAPALYAQPGQPQRQGPPPAPPQPYANPAPPQQQPHANPPVQSPQAYAATYVASAAVAATQAAPSPYQPTMMAEQPTAPAPHIAPPGPPAAGNGPSLRVDAELGAHSPSNFYKGLSGNDVVEHGGIFIATYKIPKVGQALTVHVSMPGGYEFDAAAIVRWTRETVDSSAQSGSAPPGFGAQFTQIAPEARQLIYRYVRNREPLFHDDL
jgi:hypothetical protein